MKAIPLTIYIESITTIVVTKGYAQVQDSSGFTIACYYIYLASIYCLQILRVIFTKFLKGYSRGWWIQIASIVQFAIHFSLIVGLLAYLNHL